MDILKKNLFPAHLIERVVNRYVTGNLSNHCPQVSFPTSPTFFFKLPYIGHFSVVTFFEPTITSRKSRIVLLIHTLSRFMYIPLILLY